MSKLFKIMVSAAAILLVGGVTAIIMAVTAYTSANKYEAHLKMAFNAASYNYLEGSPEGSVRMTVDGQEYEIDIDNYKLTSFYLTQGTVGTYVPEFLMGDEMVTGRFCDTDELRVYRKNADEAYAVFETGSKKYKMRIKWDDLWENLTTKIVNGFKDTPNRIVDN